VERMAVTDYLFTPLPSCTLSPVGLFVRVSLPSFFLSFFLCFFVSLFLFLSFFFTRCVSPSYHPTMGSLLLALSPSSLPPSLAHLSQDPSA